MQYLLYFGTNPGPSQRGGNGTYLCFERDPQSGEVLRDKPAKASMAGHAHIFTDPNDIEREARSAFDRVSEPVWIETWGDALMYERVKAEALYQPNAPHGRLNSGMTRRIVEGLTIENNAAISLLKVHFKKCNFEGLMLTDIVFKDCTFDDCTFERACFYGVKFFDCEFVNVKAEGFEMEGAFDGCTFEDTDFTRAHLAGVDFGGDCDLSGVDWADAIVKMTPGLAEALGV